MPFAADFDEIYNLFIAEALSEAGYRVQRADDLLNQRNILHDVVAGIASADLVVADLTGSNPNVYYEVGIAHALRKHVVLLTQRVDELPFDLRSYRVIPYNTHFAAIKNARASLHETAAGALTGLIEFSSPVGDYAVGVTSSTRDDEGESGLLDHLVAVEDGFTEMGAVVDAITARTNQITEQTQAFSQKVQAIVERRDRNSNRAPRDLMRAYALALAGYAKAVEEATRSYDTSLKDVETSLAYIVNIQAPSSSDEVEQLRAFLLVLERMEQQADAARQAYTAVGDIMSQMPTMEKTLDGARKTAIARIRRYVQSVDTTIEAVARARSIGERILRRGDEPGESPL